MPLKRECANFNLLSNIGLLNLCYTQKEKYSFISHFNLLRRSCVFSPGGCAYLSFLMSSCVRHAAEETRPMFPMPPPNCRCCSSSGRSVLMYARSKNDAEAAAGYRFQPTCVLIPARRI